MEINGAPADPGDLAALALSNLGHFTSMRVDDGRVRGLDLHLRRLVRDCRTVFDAELDTGRVLAYARRAAAAERGDAFVVRITVFDPAVGVADPHAPATPHILVTTRPAAVLPLPPLSVRTVAYGRDEPHVKHVGLFGPLRRRRAALLAGFDDALFVEPDGRISEGGTWNVGFVVDDRVVWPDAPCLRGVTADLLRQLHPSPSVPVGIDELHRVQAAFATNAGMGVRPIGRIDERVLPVGHALVEQLGSQYRALPGEVL